MTDFNIEVTQQPSYTLEVAVGASGIETPTVEVVTSGGVYLEITNRDKILPSDFPDTYPISWTTGLLPIERVSGLSITGTSGISVNQSGGSYVIYTTGTFGLTGSQVQNLLNSGVSINVVSGTGNFNSLSVTGVPVSVSGHKHLVSDITNFASEVSGLLPVISITGGYGIGVTNTSGNHTIYSTLNTINEAYTLVTTVFNRNGSALPKFTVVYISGGQGDLPIVTPALANGEPKSSKTFGITQEQIPAMSSGHVVVYGNIYGLDTDQFNPNAPHGDINGQVMYLSPTVSGGLTLTKPYAPDHMVSLGTVIRTHQNEGIFNVRIQNGFELQELHNVATTGAVSGQFLKYDGSIWRNSGIISSDISDFSSAVSGISPNINISGTSGISVDKNGNNYTVYTTGTFGLSSSQVQSLLNSGVSIYITSGTGNFSSLSVNGTGVSLSGHTHSLSGVSSGLVYQNNGSIFIGTDDQTVNLEIKGSLSFRDLSVFMGEVLAGKITASELYAVGDVDILPVSLSGHQHTSSDIINFNSSVSGLLPITSIVGTSGASASLSGTTVTVAVTGSFGLTSSGIQDLLNSGVSINVISGSGNFNSLSVNNTGVSISGHSHILTIGSGSGTAITYDSSQTLNILGSGNSTVSYDNSNKTVYINSPVATRGYEILGSGKSIFTVDGGYIVGNIDVFYNGVKLLNGNDFTATNGATFSLANSGIAGDVVEWSAFSTSPRYQIIMGEVRSDFVSGVNYIGNAIQGSSESSEVWRIKKTTIDSNGSIVSNLTTNNVRWTDRLTASYV